GCELRCRAQQPRHRARRRCAGPGPASTGNPACPASGRYRLSGSAKPLDAHRTALSTEVSQLVAAQLAHTLSATDAQRELLRLRAAADAPARKNAGFRAPAL